MDSTSPVPLLLRGFVLGWSVAWPPGPINAEMIRRTLSRGFWSGYSVGAGACTGDFLWAVFVALGAGAAANVPVVRRTLGIVSFCLLLVLATTYLRGAWRAFGAMRRHELLPAPRRLEGARGGYALGLGLAITSPWNIAFWLAVVGSRGGATHDVLQSLTIAIAVVGGATLWGLSLCTAVRLGARFATPAWDLVTRASTGLLMLFFAARLALSMRHG
jgi:threonine/homoserine/homoserine lactone efflux protein